jgi:hypothetical protein
MSASHLPTLLQMRLLVGFLGERAQYGWWPTAFYDASSRPFLEPVFSKTSQLAQYHGVLEAARQLHDEHLSVGSYHLFRMPEEIEQDLHMMLQGGVGQELASRSTESKDTALVSLTYLAPSKTTLFNIGPTALGNIKNLESADTMEAIAGAYFWAFSHNAKTFPYLVR